MRLLTHLALATLGLAAIPAFASSLMPDLSLIPTGWSVDRFAPSSFSNLGTVNGQGNVLGIGIGASGDFANRPTNFQDPFYNTQGEIHSISGGAGDSVAVLLFVPELWSNPTNGDVRTDLWVHNGTDGNFDYGILGFTNFGTGNRFGMQGATFQIWDDVAGKWTAVPAAVKYGQWNRLEIQYTGTAYDYLINDVSVGTANLGVPNIALTQVLLEAYNYNNPTFGVSTNPAYTADYAGVPEPASFGLIGLGLLGLAAFARRKFRP